MAQSDDDYLDLPDPNQRSFTVDDNTSASNPGRTRMQPWVWIAHYPKWPFLLGGGLIGTAAGGWYLHWSLWILAVLFAAANFFYWMRVKEHFRSGCINASVVIGMNPMRIAVATDLSTGVGSYPVVKIIEKKLSMVAGGQPQVGTRLATVALYEAAVDDEGNVVDGDHWKDFDPVPVECATSDVAAQQRALESISEEEFRELDAALAKLPDPPATGLHRLWEDA